MRERLLSGSRISAIRPPSQAMRPAKRNPPHGTTCLAKAITGFSRLHPGSVHGDVHLDHDAQLRPGRLGREVQRLDMLCAIHGDDGVGVMAEAGKTRELGRLPQLDWRSRMFRIPAEAIT